MKTLIEEGKEELRGKMLREEEDFFSPRAYQRWMNPLYRGRIDNPDGHARLTGKCGETIEIAPFSQWPHSIVISCHRDHQSYRFCVDGGNSLGNISESG